MRKSAGISWIILSILIWITGCKKNEPDLLTNTPAPTHSAVTPVRNDAEEIQDWYGDRHEAVNERLSQGNASMLFIGNSITHGWEWDGAPIRSRQEDQNCGVLPYVWGW